MTSEFQTVDNFSLFFSTDLSIFNLKNTFSIVAAIAGKFIANSDKPVNSKLLNCNLSFFLSFFLRQYRASRPQIGLSLATSLGVLGLWASVNIPKFYFVKFQSKYINNSTQMFL